MFSILFLLTEAVAKEYYITLGYVEDRDTLRTVAARLHSLGLHAYSSDKADYKVVYTGPFETLTESQKRLVEIRRLIAPDAFIVVFSPMAKTVAACQKKTEKKEMTGPFFVGFSAGGSYVDSKKTEEPILHYEPDDTGYEFGTFVGYDFDDRFFSTLNYQYTRLDDISINDYFATINYRFPLSYAVSPFVGALGGYSTMEWRNNPFQATDSDSSSGSFMGGGQLGVDIPLNENMKIFTLYRFILMDHKTSISTNSDSGEIEHNANHALEMGLRYNF